MKLRFSARKGSRIKSRCFIGATTSHSSELWWFKKLKVWAPLGAFNSIACSDDYKVRSVRAFRRYLRKLAGKVPAGTEFILRSRYDGHDVYGKVPKTSRKRRA